MATGDPTGDDLCSVSFNTSDLVDNTDYSETVEVTFDSSFELVSGVKYVIVARATADDEFDWVEWGQHTANTYANGLRCYSTDAGETWTQAPTRDNYFITKAAGVAKDSNSGAVTSVLNFYSNNWAAQTFTASSTYTITSAVLKLWKRGAGSTGVVTISIRRVETAFTPPVPTGLNNMLTVKRLVVAAYNKIYYESI